MSGVDFEHAQNLERTSTEKGLRYLFVTYLLSFRFISLSCVLFVLYAFVILYFSVRRGMKQITLLDVLVYYNS